MFKISKISRRQKSRIIQKRRTKRNKITKFKNNKLNLERKTSYGSMKDEMSLESIEDQLILLEKKDEVLKKNELEKKDQDFKEKNSGFFCFEHVLFCENDEKRFFKDFQICQRYYFLSDKKEEIGKEVEIMKKMLVPDK